MGRSTGEKSLKNMGIVVPKALEPSFEGRKARPKYQRTNKLMFKCLQQPYGDIIRRSHTSIKTTNFRELNILTPMPVGTGFVLKDRLKHLSQSSKVSPKINPTNRKISTSPHKECVFENDLSFSK